MTRDQKLERWAERELQRNINNLIIENDNGSVLAFGRWEISPKNNYVQVRENDQEYKFSSKRSAISWCVASKLQSHRLKLDIEYHDSHRLRLLTDIRAQKQLAKNSKNHDYRELVLTKIQGQQYRLRDAERELRKSTNQAKYLQLRGFAK